MLGSKRRIEFNSEAIEPRDRYSYWNDVVCARLSPSENLSLVAADAFRSKLINVEIGAVNLCHLSASPMRYDRTRRMISDKPNDDIFIAVIERGSGQFAQLGREQTPHAGDVLIYDSGRPFKWNLSEDTAMMIAMMPRDKLERKVQNLHSLMGRMLPAGQVAAGILKSNMREFLKIEHCNSSYCEERLESSLMDIISSSIEFGFYGDGISLSHRDILEKAKRYILDNMDDPRLSTDLIARCVGTSRRTLFRAFACDGTTLVNWLSEQRLDRAFALLHGKKVNTVTQAAILCGYEDFSNFTRAFKHRFGTLPKDILKRQVAI